MKNLPTYLKLLAAGFLASAMLMACSDDWDDHYETGKGSSLSIWQTIEANHDLSNFARILKACGYDKNLNGNQSYTVFALDNNTLTDHETDSLIGEYNRQKGKGVRDNDNTVVHQVVQNHIALYRHSVSEFSNDTIVMMNGKYEPMTAGGINGNAFTDKSISCANGELYQLAGRISYFPNIYEYLGKDEDLDSVYAFLRSYSVYKFMESASVPGEIVNGKTTYLDSVVVLQNSLFEQLGQINAEDSTYWMLAPTNSEWSRLVNEYSNYFVYQNSIAKSDSMQYANTRMAILRGAFFNRSVNPDKAFRDSAVSTTAQSLRQGSIILLPGYVFYHPFNSGGIFDGATNITCSNGNVLKTTHYAIDKRNTFLQDVKVEAESYSAQDSIVDAVIPLTTRTVSSTNPWYGKISGNGYVDIVASNTSTDPNHYPMPNVYFTLPNLLSNVGYDIYVVTAPVTAYDENATADELLPSRFRCILYYVNQAGKQQTKRLKIFTNDPTKVDTIQVASDFKFPVTSYGLSKSPTRLQVWSNVQRNQTSTYSQDMHIDCIIVKPHEE